MNCVNGVISSQNGFDWRRCLLDTEDLEAFLGDAVDKVFSFDNDGLDGNSSSRQTTERSEDLRVGL